MGLEENVSYIIYYEREREKGRKREREREGERERRMSVSSHTHTCSRTQFGLINKKVVMYIETSSCTRASLLFSSAVLALPLSFLPPTTLLPTCTCIHLCLSPAYIIIYQMYHHLLRSSPSPSLFVFIFPLLL